MQPPRLRLRHSDRDRDRNRNRNRDRDRDRDRPAPRPDLRQGPRRRFLTMARCRTRYGTRGAARHAFCPCHFSAQPATLRLKTSPSLARLSVPKYPMAGPVGVNPPGAFRKMPE